MASIMRACARPEASGAGLLALLLALAGCQPQAAGGQFEIDSIESLWVNGRVNVHCERTLRLSDEARRALAHGVPLTVELELILRSTATQTRVAREAAAYEIRYLPMSEHYQVSNLADGQVGTYPRLRHALADLGRLDLSIGTGALPAGEYELLARSRLDHSRMPPPMQLPVLLDSGWKHASAWTSWPLIVDPEA